MAVDENASLIFKSPASKMVIFYFGHQGCKSPGPYSEPLWIEGCTTGQIKGPLVASMEQNHSSTIEEVRRLINNGMDLKVL